MPAGRALAGMLAFLALHPSVTVAAEGDDSAAAAPGSEAQRNRVASCAICHGPGGSSSRASTPSLAGQPQVFLETQLILFREGVRASDAMSAQLQGVSDAELTALATHFSAQQLRPSPAPAAPARLASGKELAAKLRCASCHLDDFAGREQMPRLAGQREDYLADSLLAYRDGRRSAPDGSMNEVLYGTSDADLRALAHYLAHLEVSSPASGSK